VREQTFYYIFLPRSYRWVKTPRSGSGMNIPDHNSESLETIFWDKILKFFDADPGISLTPDPGWKKFGSGINIPDPQHCLKHILLVATSFMYVLPVPQKHPFPILFFSLSSMFSPTLT
jgi:hypothetical protein